MVFDTGEWRWHKNLQIKQHKRSTIMKKEKMNMKKLMKYAILGCLCTVVLTGCGGSGDNTNDKKKANVGVAQIVEHTSLNTIRDSFKAEMEVLGYDTSSIDFQNAGNDPSVLNSIMQTFSGNKKSVIVAIATPTAQSAANFSKDIPVVFSAVSDPITAGLVSDAAKPDKNITGTSDEIQVDQILDLALTINPDIKTLGFIYNKSEANSVSNLAKVKAYCEAKGIAIEESAVTSISDVQTNAQVLVGKVDAIFAPNDNTVASAMSALASEANKAKVPVYVGADSMVQDGGFACVGINYEDLGKATAHMVDDVLNGKAVSDIPVQVFKENLNVYVNEDVLKTLEITLPDSVQNNDKLQMVKAK